MIAGACIGTIVRLALEGWRNFPYIPMLFVVPAIIVLHPVMNKELPTLVGLDMLRSPRTYIGFSLCVLAQLSSWRYGYG